MDSPEDNRRQIEKHDWVNQACNECLFRNILLSRRDAKVKFPDRQWAGKPQQGLNNDDHNHRHVNRSKPKVSDEPPPQKTAEQDREQSENDNCNVSAVNHCNKVSEEGVPVHVGIIPYFRYA